jgi:RNA recognition motif-containing protein
MVYIVCSTTLWVGHLSKLVQQEELSDTFGEYGDIISIDLIPPRGCAFICMNRRQDSYKALNKLKNHKMQGKVITVGIIILLHHTRSSNFLPVAGVGSRERSKRQRMERLLGG